MEIQIFKINFYITFHYLLQIFKIILLTMLINLSMILLLIISLLFTILVMIFYFQLVFQFLLIFQIILIIFHHFLIWKKNRQIFLVLFFLNMNYLNLFLIILYYRLLNFLKFCLIKNWQYLHLMVSQVQLQLNLKNLVIKIMELF